MIVTSDNKIYTMRPDNKPCIYIDDGDTLIVQTCDCYDGMVVSEVDEENKIDKNRINPATGPIYVNGSQYGDTLVVDINDIKVSGKGIMRISPHFGSLSEMVDKSTFKIIDISNGTIHFSDKIRIPLRPMIGFIGTSPDCGEIDNETPGDHGGNMDTTDIRSGAKVYLPVKVQGGLLSLGDIHASMGDGEAAGTGLEVAGEVTIKLGLIKSTNQKRPYVETEDAIYTVCSAPTLEQASKLAVKDAVDIIMKSLEISFKDAYMLTSLTCNLIISQIVDPWMTVRMEIPKCILNCTDKTV